MSANQSILDRLKKQAGVNKGGISSVESAGLDALRKGQGFQNMMDQEARERAAKAEQERLKREREEMEKAEAALRESLSPTQILLSDITGGRLPESKINHVINTYAPGSFGPDADDAIPAIDPDYFWDVELLELLVIARKLKRHVLLVGPPGTGKTTATKQFAAHIRQPYARFNGKEGLEPGSILGTQWAENGGMCWKDGLLTQAVADGWFTDIDEIFKMPPGIQMAMQSLYESNGFLILDEKPGSITDKYVYPAPSWQLVATDNTKGMGDNLDLYGSGQQQDISTLDRFSYTYDVKYLPKDVEIDMILRRYTGFDKKIASKLVSYANLVRNSFLTDPSGIQLTMSPRGILSAAELITEGLSLATALQYTFISKLGDDKEISIAKEFIKSAI